MATKKKAAAKKAAKPADKKAATPGTKKKPGNTGDIPVTGQAWERGESVPCAPNETE